MKMIFLQKTRVISLCAICAGLFNAAASDQKWKLDAPIVTYWCGPGHTMPLNDRSAVQVADGGWNVGWASKPEDLDFFWRHGLRAKLDIGVPDVNDPVQAKALDATIERVRNHPALYSYHLTDEPSAARFPQLGRLVAYLRKKDPGHLAYINLFPTYASNEQLGTKGDTTTAYREHLRQFIEVVKPSLISYDHYTFFKNSDGDQYFLNLALIREASLKAGLPFLNIIQACDSPGEGWRGPGENELRWLTYTSLAYGANGISHFRYDSGLCKGPDEPNALYWSVSRFNHDFMAIATELQSLKSIGAFHCGKLPSGGMALPKDSAFKPEAMPKEILIGYFGKSSRRPTHIVVVNTDYKNAISTRITGPGKMEAFHAPTKTWSKSSGGNWIKLELPPGGGTLIRLSK